MREGQVNPASYCQEANFQDSNDRLLRQSPIFKINDEKLQRQSLINENSLHPQIRFDYRKFKEQREIDSPSILSQNQKNVRKSYLSTAESKVLNEKWDSFKKTSEQLIKMEREEKKQKLSLKKDSIPENNFGKQIYEIMVLIIIIGYVVLMFCMISRELFSDNAL